MREKTLVLIGSSPAALAAAAVQAALACWPGDDRPRTQSLSFDQLRRNDSVLYQGGAVWVLLDAVEPANLYEVIALIQDHHLPTMITRPGETRALGAALLSGVVVAPPEAPPAELCAMLRALWCQADMIRALEAEVAMLQEHQGGLCDQIGKIDEELRLAAQLQHEFLPAQLPSVNGVEFGALFRPAGYVSGDIYDVIRLDERHIGFFLADAVGHGVPAALMTVYIKRSLHVKDIDRAHPGNYRLIPPEEAMARLNHEMILHQSAKIRTASACYGIIDCETHEVAFVRAGHPFPIHLRPDGSSQLVRTEGGLLGVFPDERFEVARFRLAPGERLLFYSDGFELAFRAPGEVEGQPARVANPQYLDEFLDLARGPLDEALEHLARKLDQQVGSLNQLDDMTAVCLGVSAAAETATEPTTVVDFTAD